MDPTVVPQMASRSSSLEPLQVTLYGKKGLLNVFKNLDTEEIIRMGPKANHLYPFKREAEHMEEG